MWARGNIAGVVLAGGKSSRMGTNKALLSYKQTPLIEHMQQILKDTGIDRVIISGQVDGYESFPDKTPFQGPVKAIEDIIEENEDAIKGFLFVPVDMPLLNSDVLDVLLSYPEGAYFNERPLPAYISAPYCKTNAHSVRQMLDQLSIKPVRIPETLIPCMENVNTPEEWREIKKHEY